MKVFKVEPITFVCSGCGCSVGRFFYKCWNFSVFAAFMLKHGLGLNKSINRKVRKGLISGVAWHNPEINFVFCQDCAEKKNHTCPDCKDQMYLFDNDELGVRQPLAA
jgi:hypothetical protein